MAETPGSSAGAPPDGTAAFRDRVVIGGSAGAAEALREIVARLPADFPAAILVVIHAAPSAPRLLAPLLRAAGKLPADYAEDGAAMELGRIYVAPPDRHLVVRNGVMHVLRGPKENRSRPAIDPLFRSAAWSYGPQVIGVLLSGMLTDGTAGAWAIRTCGGIVLAQDPNEARYPEIPQHAIEHVGAHHVLPAAGIAELLQKLAREPVVVAAYASRVPEQVKLETKMALIRENDVAEMNRVGKLSPFTCPACNGNLWEINDEHMLRFRCHTGHAFNAEELFEDQDESVENALYAAAAALNESSRLAMAIAERSHAGQRDSLAAMYEQKAREAEENANVIRTLLARPRGRR